MFILKLNILRYIYFVLADVFPDCHEILLNKHDKNPAGDNTYAIDSDGAGGLGLFGVTCDFKTNKSMGITIVSESFLPSLQTTIIQSRTINGRVNSS